MPNQQPQSLKEVIHKKSVQKKQEAKGLSPIGQLDNRTIGEGSTAGYQSQAPTAPEADELLDNRTSSKSRSRNQMLNFEIDEFICQLLDEQMIDDNFVAYYAKACHTLGISTINRLRINAMNGNNPQRLFAYKVKGALQLHFKRQYLKS